MFDWDVFDTLFEQQQSFVGLAPDGVFLLWNVEMLQWSFKSVSAILAL